MKKLFSVIIIVAIIICTLLIAFSEGENEIYFGSYPQTILTDEEIISELEELKTENWISYDYYCGDGTISSAHIEDYAKFQDVIYNGEKYRGIIFESFRPTYIYKQKLNSHPARYSLNQVYWLKFEPIKWLPLDGDNNCFVTEKAIDTQPLICEETEDVINFENSSIYEFLNIQFYNCAFSVSQRELLKPFSGDHFVKLLTIDDIQNNEYISNSLTATPTEYTKINGMRVTNGVVAYWLEDSIETEEYYYSSVNYEGIVVGSEVFVLRGVRPVIKFENYSNNLYSLDYLFDGEVIKSENLEFGAEITEYIPTAIEGYVFNGWIPNNIITMPNHDFTFTADLTKSKYKLTLNANGGLFEDGNSIKEEMIELNTLLDIERPDRQGYVFDCWDIDEPVRMPNHDVTLTANWAPASDTKYTVIEYRQDFESEYQLYDSFEFEGYTDEYATYNPPATDGFTIDDNLSVTTAPISPDGSTVLKVYYSRNKYDISFDFGYDNKIIDFECLFEQPIIHPNIEEREGYSTVGWENVPSICTKSETFTLKWVPNKYQISFETCGGTYINNIVADFGEELTEPESPIKEGHTFVGWDNEFPTTMPSENIILTAIWELNKHTITWNVNGNITVDTFDYGESIDAPNTENYEGIIFVKWDNEIPNIMPDHNLMFNAIYKLLPKISILGNSKHLTVIYKTSITMYAEAKNIGNAEIEWLNKNGDIVGKGNTFKRLFYESEEITVRVVVDGVEYKDTETIKVNNTIWHKIIYVLYRLFLPTKLKLEQK